MKAAAEPDRKVRTEGDAYLVAALRYAGVRRHLLHSSGFWYAAGAGLADENAPLAFDASPTESKPEVRTPPAPRPIRATLVPTLAPQ